MVQPDAFLHSPVERIKPGDERRARPAAADRSGQRGTGQAAAKVIGRLTEVEQRLGELEQALAEREPDAAPEPPRRLGISRPCRRRSRSSTVGPRPPRSGWRSSKPRTPSACAGSRPRCARSPPRRPPNCAQPWRRPRRRSSDASVPTRPPPPTLPRPARRRGPRSSRAARGRASRAGRGPRRGARADRGDPRRASRPPRRRGPSARAAASAPGAARGGDGRQPPRGEGPPAGGPLDLNAASFEQLRELGVSVTQASSVIAARESVGGYGSLDELDGLSGFSPEQLAALKRAVRV